MASDRARLGRRTSTPASCSAWLTLAGRRCPAPYDSRLARAHIIPQTSTCSAGTLKRQHRFMTGFEAHRAALQRDCNEEQKGGKTKPGRPSRNRAQSSAARTGTDSQPVALCPDRASAVIPQTSRGSPLQSARPELSSARPTSIPSSVRLSPAAPASAERNPSQDPTRPEHQVGLFAGFRGQAPR